AVPAYPPLSRRKLPRIVAIARDADGAIALTTARLLPQLQSLLGDEGKDILPELLAGDTVGAGDICDWKRPPNLSGDTLALLQYTSGSTGSPKGVMLSHRNLLHNAWATYQVMEHAADRVFVSWLPVYHDMGLIGGILQPLYGGFPCIAMPPASFLQRPLRWLNAISKYRGTTSGAPNFAYELCLQKISASQRLQLDLSSWSVAFNGAEPIRAQTLIQFATTFADCGFCPEAFYPCYGLAEASLIVSGARKTEPPVLQSVNGSALAHHRFELAPPVPSQPVGQSESIMPSAVKRLASCGRVVPEQKVVIVHPDSLQGCSPQEVGEIWIAGPSVGAGYWRKPEDSEATFNAYVADTGEGPFLRTGDLGTYCNGELWILGRLKDMIVLRGQNFYPQDIERTVERAHPSLRVGCCAAFAITLKETEALVIVQELDFRQHPDCGEVFRAIQQAITADHEIRAARIVLIQPGSILKTSSGKIQRRACREAFLQGTLNMIAQWEERDVCPSRSVQAQAGQCSVPAVLSPRSEDPAAAVRDCIAVALELPPEAVKDGFTLGQLGLDSLRAFDLQRLWSDALGVTVSIADLFAEHTVADWIANLQQRRVSSSMTSQETAVLQHRPMQSGDCPLASAQERLWFLHQLEPDSPFYNVAIALQITGVLDLSALECSLKTLIQRHDVLRARFPSVSDRPMQIIEPEVEFTLQRRCVKGCDRTEVMRTEAQRPFDLTTAPLLRVVLVEDADGADPILLVTFHHIISDGWSVGIFLRELTAHYAALVQNLPNPLPHPAPQYADYVAWERARPTSERDVHIEYWRQKLAGDQPVLSLRGANPRPTIACFLGRKHSLQLGASFATRLQRFAEQQGVTPFMTFLAAYQWVLAAYSGQNDLCIGVPIAGRTPETQQMLGFFINTLVFKTDQSGNPTFGEFLKRVKATALEAYAHQEAPFEKVVEALRPQRSLAYNPLFQAMLIFQNMPLEITSLPDTTFTLLDVDSGTAKFDLKLSLWEIDGGFSVSLEYNAMLYADLTMKHFIEDFAQILEQAIAHPDLHLNQLLPDTSLTELASESVQVQLQTFSAQALQQAKRKAIPTR
ncbi:MAG TPA: condensation domain-containing protein, partial [Stenomitos sp.]